MEANELEMIRSDIESLCGAFTDRLSNITSSRTVEDKDYVIKTAIGALHSLLVNIIGKIDKRDHEGLVNGLCEQVKISLKKFDSLEPGKWTI